MFCKLPFTHGYIDGDRIKPCCITMEESKDPEYLKSIRKDFLNEKIPKGCEICFDKEMAGEKSYRQFYNEIHDDLTYRFDDEGNLFTKPKTFDIRLDSKNVCNLKCSMCGPLFSSKWWEDEILYEYYNGKMFRDFEFDCSEDNFEHLLSLTEEAKSIYFLGGEPFHMNNVYKFLLLLSEKKFHIENTTIMFNTNASVKKDNKLYSLLKKFKKIQLIISLDGYQFVHEYIRYPLSWNNFIQGVQNIFDLKNLVFKKASFNVTLSCLNLMDYNNIKKFGDYYDTDIYLNFLSGPEHLSINSLHPKIIENFYDHSKNNEIKSYLEKNYKFDEKLNKKMKRFLFALDETRNLDSKKYLPWCWYE